MTFSAKKSLSHNGWQLIVHLVSATRGLGIPYVVTFAIQLFQTMYIRI